MGAAILTADAFHHRTIPAEYATDVPKLHIAEIKGINASNPQEYAKSVHSLD